MYKIRVTFLTILINVVTIFSPVLCQESTTELPEALKPRRNTLDNVTIVNTATNQSKNYLIMRMNVNSQPSFVTKIYNSLMSPLRNLIAAPKVSAVMKNIATCVVNGAVEIISYYFPAPLIPIIASAASMMVPFEPVLMLRDKVPVTSYRRAFMSALNSFLGTFDRYRLDNIRDDYDPYMTKRFNRRVMNYESQEKGTGPLETTSLPAEDHRGNKGDFIYSLNKLFKTLNRLRRQGSSEDSKHQTSQNSRNYPNIGND